MTTSTASRGVDSAASALNAAQVDAAARARRLRDAFAQFATGVVVVTTAKEEGGWAAVTVNSFTSVSLDPPLVLWCLGRTSNCRQHFERAQRFTVNVLRHDQQWISNNFARPSASTWTGLPIVRTAEGDLLIQGAIATFQCTAHEGHSGGDHLIFMGRVERFAVGERARPLGFFQGSYGSFTRDQSEATPIGYSSPPDEFTLGWG